MSSESRMDRVQDSSADNVCRFKKLCTEITDLYEKKNHDYGDSFHKTYVEEGMAMPRIRLHDKLSRFDTLSRGSGQQVSGEALRDTLIDLANYALMTVMELDREKIDADSDAKVNPVKIGICFDTTFDADQTLQAMEAEINRNGFITIAALSNYVGLHDLVGSDGPNPNYHGWTDLKSVQKCQTLDGAMVYFPRAISVESLVRAQPVTTSSNTYPQNCRPVPVLVYTDGQPLPKKDDKPHS